MAIESQATLQAKLTESAKAIQAVRERKEKEQQATQFQEAETPARAPTALNTR